MKVIAPDSVKPESTFSRRKNEIAIVLVGFGDHADLPIRPAREFLHVARKFLDDVRLRTVVDRLDCIEAQSVDVVLANPVKSVLDYILSNLLTVFTVVVDCVAPHRVIAIGEVRTELPQIVSFGAKVVVDDVEYDCEAGAMCGIYQPLEALRPTIARLDCIQRDSVIPPIVISGKSCDRHDLDRGHAKRMQVIEILDYAVEGFFRGKRADMQFVDDVLIEAEATPALISPPESIGIHDLSMSVHAFRQETRYRIW